MVWSGQYRRLWCGLVKIDSCGVEWSRKTVVQTSVVWTVDYDEMVVANYQKCMENDKFISFTFLGISGV